jgi:ankyrin repeat protein
MNQLIDAVEKGNEELVLTLVSNADQADRDSALSFAAHENCKEIVEILLRFGANKDYVNNNGNTPLHRAAGNGHAPIAELLIQAGANIEAKDNSGKTPLHCAAWDPFVSTVKLLHGVAGHVFAMKLLIQAGANIDTIDNYNHTPLHDAASAKYASIVELLIQAGANIEAKDNIGKTPLHCAAEKGHASGGEWLLLAGANIEAKDNSDKTPLHCAADNGHASIVELLIQAGANIEAKDNSGNTPLHCAVYGVSFNKNGRNSVSGGNSVLEVLLWAGADTLTKNCSGNIPLDIAIYLSRDYRAISILKKAGSGPMFTPPDYFVTKALDGPVATEVESKDVPEVLRSLAKTMEGTGSVEVLFNRNLMITCQCPKNNYLLPFPDVRCCNSVEDIMRRCPQYALCKQIERCVQMKFQLFWHPIHDSRFETYLVNRLAPGYLIDGGSYV